MKILELEHGVEGGITRRAPKLAVDSLQRGSSQQRDWDVEFGRLVDRTRRKGTSSNLMRLVRPQLTRTVTTTHAMVQPYPYEAEEVREKFDVLADRWEEETRFLSMTPQITGHPAYFRIAALGYPAVPLILERLKGEVRFWFQALEAMTLENPAADAETSSAAAEAWLAWGRRRGLID